MTPIAVVVMLVPTMSTKQAALLMTWAGVVARLPLFSHAACLPAYNAVISSSLGCYTDGLPRALAGPQYALSSSNTAQTCANVCGLGGYTYAATEFSG